MRQAPFSSHLGVTLAVGLLLGLLSCRSSDGSSPGPAPFPEVFRGTAYRAFHDSDGAPVQDVLGTWETRGYGYRFVVREDGASLHCVTTSFDYLTAPPEDEDAAALFFAPGPDAGSLLLSSHPSEPPFVLERVTPELAASLAARGNPDPDDRRVVFEVFIETMREHYAFFALWEVDWEARVREGRAALPGVANDTQLYELFESMLAGIKDAHLGLSAELPGGRRGLSSNRGPTKLRIRELHDQRGGEQSLDQFFNDWYRSYVAGIEEDLLGGASREAARGVLRFGWLDDEVAYLQVMGLELPGPGSVYERLDEWEGELDRVLTALEGARGLVIDLSYNRGGRDAFTLALASRFASERVLAYRKLPVAPGDLSFDVFVEPSPRRRFQGPVVALTSDLTISSGETLALALRALPSVTLAGQPTRGAFSNMLEKPLPNGFHLSLSNERYVDADGVCHERHGVPPDVLLPVFDRDDPWQGHVEAIRAARELVRLRAP